MEILIAQKKLSLFLIVISFILLLFDIVISNKKFMFLCFFNSSIHLSKRRFSFQQNELF